MFRTAHSMRLWPTKGYRQMRTSQRRFVFEVDIFVFTVPFEGFFQTSKSCHFGGWRGACCGAEMRKSADRSLVKCGM